MTIVPHFPRLLLRERQHSWNLLGVAATPGVTMDSTATFVRSDGGGFWSCSMSDVSLGGPGSGKQRQRNATLLWRAVRQVCDGGVSPIVVWRNDALFIPFPDGFARTSSVPHSDGSPFSDGSEYFQPVIDTSTGQTLSVEMLARWQRDGEFVPTLGFIRLAEDLGLIHPLSMQLLTKGLTALSQFRRHNPELKLQINLSPLQFADRQLAVTILQMVSEYGLPSSALTVELTEGAMLLYPEQVEQTMRQFVDAGVSLHLDDFGTGYSSLARLRDLPFDTVKLDRSFVMLLAEGDSSLSQAVFDMATNMHMGLIAEGVENQIEYEKLQQIGYRQMQGFMFAYPMPAEDLVQWLDSSQEMPVALKG